MLYLGDFLLVIVIYKPYLVLTCLSGKTFIEFYSELFQCKVFFRTKTLCNLNGRRERCMDTRQVDAKYSEYQQTYGSEVRFKKL